MATSQKNQYEEEVAKAEEAKLAANAQNEQKKSSGDSGQGTPPVEPTAAEKAAQALKDIATDPRLSQPRVEGDPSDRADNGPSNSTSEDRVNDKVELLDPHDEAYSPYTDPSVGSSFLADVIVLELKNGDSPTLDTCRAEYRKQNKK